MEFCSHFEQIADPPNFLRELALKFCFRQKSLKLRHSFNWAANLFKIWQNSNAAFSVAYLFFIIYSKSTVGQLTKLKFHTSTIFICFFHTLNKAFLRNPSILRFEVPFCSGHCFLCHCIKIIFCDLNVFKAYWQSHT